MSTYRSRRHRGPQPAPKQQQQGFFQPKLTIGRPGDQYEREADAVADAVVNQGNTQATSQSPAAVQRMPITQVGSGDLQRLATPEEEKMPGTNDARMDEDRKIQEKPEDSLQIQKMDAPQEEEPVQAKEEEEPVQAMEEEEPMQAKEEEEQPMQAKEAAAPAPAAPNFSARLSARRGRGETLPQPVRREMERGIGADFSRVSPITKSVPLNCTKSVPPVNHKLSRQKPGYYVRYGHTHHSQDPFRKGDEPA